MRPFLRALGVGLAAGVVARALMRVIALVTDGDTGFDLDVSAGIVGLFVVSAAGAFGGARLARRHLLLGVLVGVVACIPLWLPGLPIAVSEIQEKAVGPAVQVASVAGIALLIVAAMVTSPLAGWRLGRRVS